MVPRLEPVDQDALPSWNEGPTKQALVEFVRAVTQEGGPDHVSASERIAVFDNDGTLWPEGPVPVQIAFVADRVRTLASLHPEWRTIQPFRAVLEGDQQALAAAGLEGLATLRPRRTPG
jgi:hypothetical protein